MPKEINVIANERVDLEDFVYGTRTFTVDSFRDHVHRIFTGDYRGGFVLEGFRVEIVNADEREIAVHNGIAIARDGRLITYESPWKNNEGKIIDGFSSNEDIIAPRALSSTPGKKYISIEFDLSDSDPNERAIWDPTFDNGTLADDADDVHPLPKGKEFPIDVPTRKSHSFRLIESDAFEDSSNPNSVRIPVAVINISNKAISVDADDRGPATTTITERPALSGDVTSLSCHNTRLFRTSSVIQIISAKTNAIETISGNTLFSYTGNDRNNGILSGFSGFVPAGDIEIGDIVIAAEGDKNEYIKAGSQYDCRPMFFGFTEPTASTKEFGVSDVEDTGVETRNMRYYGGKAILNKPENYTLGQKKYPADNSEYFEVVRDFPKRTELNIQNIQDFSKSLATIIREMKYGVPVDGGHTSSEVSSAAEENRLFTLASTSTFPDISKTKLITDGASDSAFSTGQLRNRLSTDMVGGTVLILDGGLAGQTRTIESIEGLYTINLSSGFGSKPVTGTEFNVIYNQVTDDTKFVDVSNIGTLNEVYRARIDRVVNTYSRDLQERLSANKIPTVTVGDGINTFGDYIGDNGLSQAFNDVFDKNLGGIIYVKRGKYILDANPHNTESDRYFISSNTIIMGDGPIASQIFLRNTEFSAHGTGKTVGDDAVDGASGWDFDNECNNIGFSNIGITAAPITDTVATHVHDDAVDYSGRFGILTKGENTRIKNIRIDNVYFRGGSIKDSNFKAKRFILNFYMNDTSKKVDRDILIRDSTFFIEGVGINFEGAKDIKIDNCTFQSESFEDASLSASNNASSDTGFVAMAEGMRFGGRAFSNAPSSSLYGSGNVSGGTAGAGAIVPGGVSITNCKFIGRQTITNHEFGGTNAETSGGSGGTPRGWIYVAAGASGKGFNINNCQFIGDPVGQDDSGALSPVSYHAHKIQNGCGITLTSPQIMASIQSCTFDSYAIGVMHHAGTVLIGDCSFLGTYKGIVEGGKTVSSGLDTHYDWTDYDGESGDTGVDYNYDLLVNNCYFEGKYIAGVADSAADYTGIHINDRETNGNSIIKINGCTFSYLSDAIWYNTFAIRKFDTILSVFGGLRYDSFEVMACTFKKCEMVIAYRSSCSSLLSMSDLIWTTKTISFCDNKILECTARESTGVSWLLSLGARHIVCDRNIVLTVRASSTYGECDIFVFEDFDTVSFKSNNISDLYPDDGPNWCIANFAFGIIQPKINIESNVINVGISEDNQITNGFLFQSSRPHPPGYDPSTDDFPRQFPTLIFSNNDLKFRNCNYLLRSSSAAIGDFVEAGTYLIWGWHHINCIGNNIHIENSGLNTSVATGGHKLYHTASFVSTHANNNIIGGKKYLMTTGTTNTSEAPINYMGILDFRRMKIPHDDSPTSANVSNNNIVYDVPNTAMDNTDTQNGKTESIAGIRFTSWPMSLTIANNNLSNCPVSVNFNWKCPDNDSSLFGPQSGYNINIFNNIMRLKSSYEHISKVLSVSPSMGFNGSQGTSYGVTSIIISQNKISCGEVGHGSKYNNSSQHLIDLDMYSSREVSLTEDDVYTNFKFIQNSFHNCFLRFGDEDRVLNNPNGLHNLNFVSTRWPSSLIISDNIKSVTGPLTSGYTGNTHGVARLSYLNIHIDLANNYSAVPDNPKYNSYRRLIGDSQSITGTFPNSNLKHHTGTTGASEQNTHKTGKHGGSYISGYAIAQLFGGTPVTDFAGIIQEQYHDFYSSWESSSIEGTTDTFKKGVLYLVGLGGRSDLLLKDSTIVPVEWELNDTINYRLPVMTHMYNHLIFIAERNTVLSFYSTANEESKVSDAFRVAKGNVIRYKVGIDTVNPGGDFVA